MRSAASASVTWAGLPAPERGRIVQGAAALLRERAAAIARDLTCEEGKTLVEAKSEVAAAADLLDFFAGEGRRTEGQYLPSGQDGTALFTRRRPLGVVGLITPFNFPIFNPCVKVGAALATGNTIVLKPASITPISAAHLALALSDAGLPAGVFNVVFGAGDEVGLAIVRDPAIGAVSFTGSEASALTLRRAAAERGIPLLLELGGKNAIVVLSDADVRFAASMAVSGAFGCTGQRCNATSRVIVVREVAAELCDEIARLTAGMRVGDGLDSSVQVGPQADGDLLAHTESVVAQAMKDGARLRIGGSRAAPQGSNTGFFYLPTVLEGVSPDMAIAREEVFGPVLGVTEVADVAEAIHVVNDTRFGASASIFTESLAKAWQFVDGCEVGLVKVNDMTPGLEPHAPFAGWKATGSGHPELGTEGLEFYTRMQTIRMRYRRD